MSPGPWLIERAQRTPRAEALVAGDRRLSFAELAAEAEALAARLAAAGVGAGDRVALRLGGAAFVTALHAIWRLGAQAVPLNSRLAQREVEAQLARAKPCLFLDGEDALASLPAAHRELPPAAPLAASADAVVVFTSGTGGSPKAARLGFGNLLASAVASAFHLGSLPDDRWLACLPLYHVGGLSILTRAVLGGAATVVHAGFDAERVNATLDDEGITLVSLVPTTLRRLLDARGERRAPRTLRAILLGGAAAPRSLLARARALGFPVLPTYGLTEAASQVATAAPGSSRDAGVGPPLPGTRVRIVRADGSPCATDEIGEIQVSGPTVFLGYLHDTAATRAALGDGWLHSGDLGALDSDGVLHVLDRRSDLVVSGGENVAPAEVEGVLLEHPDVTEAAVFGRPDPDLGQRVAAWVVLRSGATFDAVALHAHCRARLAGYKVPRDLECRASLPRNALGKVARATLGSLR